MVATPLSFLISKAEKAGLTAEIVNGQVVVHIPDPLNLGDVLKKPWVLLSPALIYFHWFKVSIIENRLEYSIKVRVGRVYLSFALINLFLIAARIREPSNELVSLKSILVINSTILFFYLLAIFLDWRILKNRFFRPLEVK